jgi:hypothetical protein
MESNFLEIIAQYGISGALLLIMLHWLVKHYLPEHQRQHKAELERILQVHDRNTNRMVDAVDRCSRIVHFNSQAMLVQSFAQSGLSEEDAERIVRRIVSASLEGCSACNDPASGRHGGSNGQAAC